MSKVKMNGLDYLLRKWFSEDNKQILLFRLVLVDHLKALLGLLSLFL